MKTVTDWTFRNRKDSVALVISYDRILLLPMADSDTLQQGNLTGANKTEDVLQRVLQLQLMQ